VQEPGGIETVRLLPPLGAIAPFGLHVVLDLAEPRGGRGPWVRLSEADDFARVYLAAVKGDQGSLLELCALKLMPDAWPDGATPATLGVTNHDLEDRWERENARLVELRALSPHFPRLVRIDAAGETAGRLPPLLYSRPGRSFFVPPCPRCRNPLSLCRDEEWLAGAGLPSFASTLERFLWCELCAKGPEAPTVYTTSPIGAPRAAVRSAVDLLDDLVRALREVWTQDEAVALVGAETANTVRALPAGSAAGAGSGDFFTPLTFYGSPFLLTVAAPFDLEALADALGGRPWEELPVPSPRAGGAFPPRWAWLVHAPAPTRRLLFPSESSGLDAVEIFFLKLTAFRQIVEGVIDYQRATGRPHLDLHPRHLLFELAGAGDGLPVFWTLQARIHGLAAAAVPLPAPGSPTVVLPGQGLAVPYAAPEVQEFRLAGYRPGEFVFTDIDEEGTAARRFRLRGRLSDPYGLFPTPRPRDAIFLSLPDPTLGFGFTGLAVRATPGEIRSDEAAFESDLIELEESGLRRLRIALGTKLPGSRYRVFPDFGTPTDLYALGVSLLRLLLRNDEQDLAAALKAADRLGREVAAGAPEARRDVTLAALFKRAPDAALAFSKTQIFWGKDDRRGNRPNAIPNRLWERALLLGLRLVTRVTGFSVAAGPADFDPLFREEKLERILPEIVGILAELQSLLFERQPLHLEIQQVLAEIREDERAPGTTS
jgi:hypothetical protein